MCRRRRRTGGWRRCRQLQKGIQSRLHAEAVGAAVEVLVDSVSRRRETELSGRTTGNTVVNFPGDASQLGSLVRSTSSAPGRTAYGAAPGP